MFHLNWPKGARCSMLELQRHSTILYTVFYRFLKKMISGELHRGLHFFVTSDVTVISDV